MLRRIAILRAYTTDTRKTHEMSGRLTGMLDNTQFTDMRAMVVDIVYKRGRENEGLSVGNVKEIRYCAGKEQDNKCVD